MTGKWIVFDGVGCSGKSTLTKALQTAYNQKYEGQRPPALLFGLPRRTGLGALLREFLAGQRALSERALIALFFADFCDCYQTEIQPALSKGHLVICDRWYYSTFVYQCDDLPVENLFTIAEQLLPHVPDQTFILNPPVDTILERLKLRGALDDRYDDGDQWRLFTYHTRYNELRAKQKLQKHSFQVFDETFTVSELLSKILPQL